MTPGPDTYRVEVGGRVWLCKLLTPSEAVAAHVAAHLPVVSRPDPSGLPPVEPPPPTDDEVMHRTALMEVMICAVVRGAGKVGGELRPVRLSRTEHDPAAGVWGLARLPPGDYNALVEGYGRALGGLADELATFLG